MSAARETAAQRLAQAARHFEPTGTDVAFVADLREAARQQFEEAGLPGRHIEAWRHISLAALEKVAWQAPEPQREAVSLADAVLGDDDADRVVFVDGRLHAGASAASLPCTSIAAARSGAAGPEAEALLREILGSRVELKTPGFAALATAFLDDGALVEIPAESQREKPIHVVFSSEAPACVSAPRLGVVARANSQATIIVECRSGGDGPHLQLPVIEIDVEANAQLDVVLIERGREGTFVVSNLQATQARDARLRVHTLTVGEGFVRNDLAAQLGDPGAEADMRGLFIGSGQTVVDNHTTADHALPHCASRELYKGILGDRAHGVFCGRVVVRPDAQKSDSSQSNPNLLLTDRAQIDTQPQLEIYADDVKCSHGSTIGQLDEEALFYLRSRGLSLAEARVLLTRGFANEIVDALPGEALRASVHRLVAESLSRAIESQDGANP